MLWLHILQMTATWEDIQFKEPFNATHGCEHDLVDNLYRDLPVSSMDVDLSMDERGKCSDILH